MRDLICGAVVGALALAACQGAVGKPQAPAKRAPEPRAAAAEAHGVSASFRADEDRGPGKGYSARTRRMTECLASYPRYDPRIDRIRVRPGVTRPCDA